MKLYVAIFVAGAFAGALTYNLLSSPDVITNTETISDTVTVVDYVPKYYTIEKTDTLFYVDSVYVMPDVDSLWREALAYWDSVSSYQDIGYYVAEFDTTHNLMHANAKFISPLPLSPRGRFEVSLTRFNEPEPNRFGVGFHLGVGGGYSDRIAPVVYLGVGLNYNLYW